MTHVIDVEAQGGGKDHVRVRAAAAAGVVGAQHEVGAFPPAECVDDAAEGGAAEAGHQADADAGGGEAVDGLFRTGDGGEADPVDDRVVRAFERVVRRLRACLVGEDFAEDREFRLPPAGTDLGHRARVRLGPGTIPWVASASANARSTTPPSATLVPARSRQASVMRAESPTAHLRAPRRYRIRVLAVRRGRLGPQVELGPVLLEPTPNRKTTEGDQRKNDELLHGGSPSNFD